MCTNVQKREFIEVKNYVEAGENCTCSVRAIKGENTVANRTVRVVYESSIGDNSEVKLKLRI